MKILVISDIHQKIALVNQILEKQEKEVDLTVFLGDYFDDFNDNQYEVNAMATWLKSNLYKEKRIFLIGNHDFHYRVLPYALYCSGYAHWKHEIIQAILSENDWNQIRYFYNVNNFWFSHAGITEKWFSHPVHGLTPETIENTLIDVEKAVSRRDYGAVGPVWAADRFRGGPHRKGGLLWNDLRNSEFIPDVTQVMGHTPVRIPLVDTNEETNSKNIFCDTHLGHYLVIDTNLNQIDIYENK